MTGNRQAELRTIYQGMNTDALLQLHAAGTLTDDAYTALEAVLQSRSVAIPARPRQPATPSKITRSARWARGFAVIGLVLPIICLVLDFKPTAVMRICELCWPSGFMLLATEGQFNLAVVAFSITINAFIWGGLGWLVGYGLSSRAKQ
jgi:hypothetical protein